MLVLIKGREVENGILLNLIVVYFVAARYKLTEGVNDVLLLFSAAPAAPITASLD